MALELITGPPGSGKTTLLLAEALAAARAGGRVWWIGLPNQRSYLYRRATGEGGVLGLEFMTLQQVYYRLLAHARRLRPLVVATGRLALTGEALLEERSATPSPGEAKLFASAIAEAKRYGLSPDDIAGDDPETERLRQVFRRYELLKGDAWDYDDFRLQALRLAEAGEALPEADLLVVDGFREIGPLDLRLLSCLAGRFEVRLALPQSPPNMQPHRILPERSDSSSRLYEAPNPVAEARWVMRALKRDLACGADPLDLAVILPEGEIDALTALADEYGVPVMDERGTALADSKPGRKLVDLLELPEHPTASRLLPIAELSALSSAALEAKLAGENALRYLAGQLGLASQFDHWFARLQVPADPVPWAAELVEFVVTAEPHEGHSAHASLDVPAHFARLALEGAKEAARVARGSGFREWWAALLRETSLPARERGGVALLTERLASGRRFDRVYLLRANEGAYGSGEAEDYFVSEDLRVPQERLFRAATPEGQLPRRFGSRDRRLFADLRSRGREVIITYPSADRSGPLLPEPELTLRGKADPLPELPAASELELTGGEAYRAPLTPQDLGDPLEIPLESLRAFDECSMRYWLESLLEPERRGEGWWRYLRRQLIRAGSVDGHALEELAKEFPSAAEWLAEYAERLSSLRFGVELPANGRYPQIRLDAAERNGREGTVYLFTEPTDAMTEERAVDLFKERWAERLACKRLLEDYHGAYRSIRIVVWPLLGPPVTAISGVDYVWRSMSAVERSAAEATERFRQGTVKASPGFRCRECPVRDVCREGQS